jgi:peptidoglycan/LPS O-acetylase OafA/YrhL
LLVGLRTRSYRVLLGLSCAIAVGAWILRVVLVDGGATQTRIYNGTDTRADALMIGAALAIALASGKGPSKRTMQRVARWIVPAAALGLLYLLVHSSYGDAAMLKYGTVAVSVCSTVLIWAMVTENGGPIGRVLSREPLVWLGRISYPIYLWHLPVIAFLIATDHQELLYPLALPVTLALAAATFYCLEMPVMRLRRHLRRA